MKRSQMLLHGWRATSTTPTGNGNAQLWVHWVSWHIECTRAMFQNVYLLNYVFSRFRMWVCCRWLHGQWYMQWLDWWRNRLLSLEGWQPELPFQVGIVCTNSPCTLPSRPSWLRPTTVWTTLLRSKHIMSWLCRESGSSQHIWHCHSEDRSWHRVEVWLWMWYAGGPEHWDLMCRHIPAVVKSSEERRLLATEGGTGNKWQIYRFQAFTTYAVQAPSPCEAEVLLQNQQNMFPSNVVMPELCRQQGQPTMKRALSQGEKHHSQGVKRANLPDSEGSSVVICGQCGSAGHDS